MKVIKLLFVLMIGLSISCNDPVEERLNVVMIISDDLRSELSCYGHDIMHTPNIDELAAQGVLFERAYVQQSVCAASRASFLTGVRPNTTGVNYPYSQYFVEEYLPYHETISRYFSNKGYYSRNFGKIHHGKDYDALPAPYFDPMSDIKGAGRKFAIPEHIQVINEEGNQYRPAVEMAVVHDTMYQDGQTTIEVLKTLRQVKSQANPFFLAVGYYKPHLPFNAPKKYWDLYDRKEIAVAENKYLPIDAPKYSTTHYALKNYDSDYSDHDKIISDSAAITLKHAYYACVSFIDAQVGMITQELEKLGLRENTIVVFMSDHGWHLGEQGMWGKTTNYENAVRAPLIISVPKNASNGSVTAALSEYVDIFPTLIDAAGMSGDIPEYLEGTSLLPLIENPKRPWKKAAFSQFPRGTNAESEGYSMRTDQYRFTEWWDNENDTLMKYELYDHAINPLESVNRAYLPEYIAIRKDLHQMMREGWKGALPEGIVNNSNNEYALRPIAYGNEGVSRRKNWAEYLEKKKREGKDPKFIYERY